MRLRLSLPSFHGDTLRLEPFRGLQPGFTLTDTLNPTIGDAVGEVYLNTDKDVVDRACAAFNAVMDAHERASRHGEHAVERALDPVE